MDFAALSKQYEEYIIALRRDFHAHPELSFEEERTARVVCGQLGHLGIPHVRLAHNCVVGKLVGGKAEQGGRRLAIRADMDALPIQEEAETPFKSEHEGVMHACGHDGHTAMLLGAAAMLKQAQPELGGTVYLCFQSAEEVGGGARGIVDYLLAEGGVDRAIAAHLMPGLDSGLISVEEGARMAATNNFMVEVTGRGGHASQPELCIDPIKPLCRIVLDISAIPANRVAALEPCVVHVGRVAGGTQGNIIPQKATAWGGFRTFSTQQRARLPELIREIAEHTALAHGAAARVEFYEGPPVVNNDAQSVALAREVLGRHPVLTPASLKPICASEDFGMFLEQFGGFMCFIGIRNEKKGLVYDLHHPRFGIDEDVLGPGAAFFALYADAFLNGG